MTQLPLLPQVEHAVQRRAEAPEMSLGHAILGAARQRLAGAVVSEVAGIKDERNLRCECPGKGQGLEAVERRRGIVREDQVAGLLAQLADERRAVCHHGVPGAGKLSRDQHLHGLGLREIVLQVQDPQPAGGLVPRLHVGTRAGKRGVHHQKK